MILSCMRPAERTREHHVGGVLIRPTADRVHALEQLVMTDEQGRIAASAIDSATCALISSRRLVSCTAVKWSLSVS